LTLSRDDRAANAKKNMFTGKKLTPVTGSTHRVHVGRDSSWSREMMASVSAQKILVRKPIYISHPKKIQAKVTVTRLVAKVLVQVVNLWFLKPILAKVTAVIAVAAPATIRTTGHKMANVMNGTHRVPVLIPSFLNTTKKSGRLSVFVTQEPGSSFGTKPVGATEFTPRGLVLTTPGLFPPETCPRCTVSVGMVTTLLLRSMSVRGRHY